MTSSCFVKVILDWGYGRGIRDFEEWCNRPDIGVLGLSLFCLGLLDKLLLEYVADMAECMFGS